MKRNLLIITLLLFSVSLTGCNIKFIEKVEPEPTEETIAEENFGSLIIEETSESTTKISETTSESISETSEEESEETVEEGVFNYAGIKFLTDDTEPTLYCKEDCSAKISPSTVSKDYATLKKGEFVTLKAVSEDSKWAMVSVFGGPSSFVLNEYLTTEEIRQEQVLSEVAPVTSETQTTESVSNTESSSQTTQQQSTEQQPISSESSEQQTYQPPQEPVDNYSGIGFPSDASSTSFNMGVEFADVTVTLRVRKNGTQVSEGPDNVSNASGYYSLGTLNAGDSVSCTGIGRNGFVRVDYGGTVGFINSKNVEY